MSSRFVVELEFIQYLCNPGYLIFLHQNKYFEDPVFVDFLKYLRYFETPPFRNYLAYPLCLPILNSLNNRESYVFKSLKKNNLSLLHDQIWKLWKNNK